MFLDTNINEPAENKSKESILSFFKRHCLLTSIFLVLGAGVASAQMWKEGRSDVCGGSDLVHFTFNDTERTKFSIPEPYLDSIMKIHNDGPYNTIAMNIKLDDFSPNCEGKRETGQQSREYIHTSLKPFAVDKLSGLLEMQKFIYSQIAEPKGDFFVFRSINYIPGASLRGERELRIPKDKKLRDKYFLFCNWWRGDRITGCTVTQHIKKGIYADYIIDEDQIKNIDKLSTKVDQKIISFIK